MSRRGENIRKRADGRWEGRLKSGFDAFGKAQYRSFYGKTYGEVKNKLLAAIRNENSFETAEICFADVLELWLSANRVRLKRATENKYRNIIESHILPTMGNVPLCRISSAVINDFLHEKMKSGRLDGDGGLSPSYVRSIMIVINSALCYAAREGMCRPLINPIHKPAAPPRKPPVLSATDTERLSMYAIEHGGETGLGVLLSLCAGLRIGEICALRWSDVNLDAKVLHVRHTVSRVRAAEGNANKTELILDEPKTKMSSRDIPISEKLIPLLCDAKSRASSPFVVSCTAGFVSPRTYEYRYRQLLKKCGIPSVNYHALRHTFATRCVDAGVDIKTLSEVLGHADASVTLNTYVHPSMEQKRRQLEKLAL